jgi:hypothetical protein
MKKLLLIFLFAIPLLHGMKTEKKEQSESEISSDRVHCVLKEYENVLSHILHTDCATFWFFVPKEIRKQIVQYVIEVIRHRTYIYNLYHIDRFALKNTTRFKTYDEQTALRVISCIELKQFGILQTMFDYYEQKGDRSLYMDNPYGYSIEYLKKQETSQLKQLYDLVSHRQLTLTVALKMVYGERQKWHIDNFADNLDALDFYYFFHGGGVRSHHCIEIYDHYRFGDQLKTFLKDFLALIQPMLWWPVESLTIEKNELSTLPDTLAWLEKLRVINIRHNKFTEVPEVIKQCKHLQYLYLDGNPIQKLPLWMVDCGWKKLEIQVNEHIVVPWDEQKHTHIKVRRGYSV